MLCLSVYNNNRRRGDEKKNQERQKDNDTNYFDANEAYKLASLIWLIKIRMMT